MQTALFRYAARPDADGRCWSVIDRECGSYVRAGGRWLAGLGPQAAAEWVAALNRSERGSLDEDATAGRLGR
ncbi:hypothetical protein [Azospirillum sp. SYSU D00513]|uniref:hypothetical protein n=1 Tax=Azospirillum sp. SYSU D00513 TaxID=2812561 RepID=UPI001A96606D|nr:hypothetical protein [Azospirillum sp. SYSU D00513]